MPHLQLFCTRASARWLICERFTGSGVELGRDGVEVTGACSLITAPVWGPAAGANGGLMAPVSLMMLLDLVSDPPGFGENVVVLRRLRDSNADKHTR